MRTTTLAALAAAYFFPACSGGHSPVPAVSTASSSPHLRNAATGGEADALASELLLAGQGGVPDARGPASLPVQDPDVAAALDAIALDHLRSEALGAGTGPRLLGSATVRRLAQQPDAPADQNGNGSNLDETLAEESRRVAAFAGAPLPLGTAMPLFAWHQRSADLAGPLVVDDVNTWTTTDAAPGTLRLADVAAFLRLRALAARRLLAASRGPLAGDNATEGMLGLVAMQQALAAEETLFASLFTRGGPLLSLDDPRHYDPSTQATWLPREANVTFDAQLAGAPASYRATDAASDLVALSDLTTAATALLELSSPNGPLGLTRLLQGQPFKPVAPSTPTGPAPLTWTHDIGPLVEFHCGGCHLGFGEGGMVIDTYAQFLLGGNRTRAMNLTLVVPGNHGASFLHAMLTGPPAPFRQMPLGGSLAANEIQQIDDWIDAGALENAPVAPPPPQPGEDLAQVSFVNLVALHFDPATGALHHRREADGVSHVATALATGHALQALAALVRTRPGLAWQGHTPANVLDAAATFAASRCVDAQGHVLDALKLPTFAGERHADLRAHAAMVAGLLAAAAELPANHPAAIAGALATTQLLSAFRDVTTGWFRNTADGDVHGYSAAELSDLLAALRLAEANHFAGAAAARAQLLRQLRPALAFAEWPGHGEVIGDGIDDTDGNGLREPAAAGGAHGRLPLLAGSIAIGTADTVVTGPITWSEHVRPLLLQKCGECHLGGNARGNYRLDTLALLATPGDSGGVLPMLVPGHAEASWFWRKLVDRGPAIGMQMPLQRSPLDPTTVAMLAAWITDGASSR